MRLRQVRAARGAAHCKTGDVAGGWTAAEFGGDECFKVTTDGALAWTDTWANGPPSVALDDDDSNQSGNDGNATMTSTSSNATTAAVDVSFASVFEGDTDLAGTGVASSYVVEQLGSFFTLSSVRRNYRSESGILREYPPPASGYDSRSE